MSDNRVQCAYINKTWLIADIMSILSSPAFRFEAAVEALSDAADLGKSKAAPASRWMVDATD